MVARTTSAAFIATASNHSYRIWFIEFRALLRLMNFKNRPKALTAGQFLPPTPGKDRAGSKSGKKATKSTGPEASAEGVGERARGIVV